MEFDEVSHFVKHGKVAPIDEHNIDALGVSNPFYPTFPCPQPIATTAATKHNKKKRALTAKLVSSVRHRLQKSATTTSDDDDNDDHQTDGRDRGTGSGVDREMKQQQIRRTGRHHPLFKRLKRSHGVASSTPRLGYSSSGEEIDGGYLSLDDIQQRWQKQRRRILRRPATLLPVQLQHKQKHRGRDSNRIEDPMFLRMHNDLRQISDQMKQFQVPADWPILDGHQPLSPMASPLPMPAKHSITTKHLMADLTGRIEKYHYLCAQERTRIETNQQAIEDHITMLRELDRNVEALNAKIGHARTEKIKRETRILRDIQRRSPFLLEAHAVHKKTVRSIEGYLRGLNSTSRLAELRIKVDRVREYQLMWSQVQQWVPSMGKRFALFSLSLSFCSEVSGRRRVRMTCGD
ncbi:hypothetical protein BX666DRAFT_178422 [Dichotomocladium elegans]|nr:hypothetical protein BX666DRAFT_178422 [Dichotomocladium elegans]